MSIYLTATTETLELTTGAAVSTDWSVSYADHTTTAFVPGSAQGNVATATTTPIVSAPAGSTQRQIKRAFIVNRGTATQTVTVKKDISGTEIWQTPTISLLPGESLTIDAGGNILLRDSAGRVRKQATEIAGITGRSIGFYKIGTAAEAVGVRYSWAKDSGLPGAWAPGTPGLAGRATNGTQAADNGTIPWQDPSSGAMYLTEVVSTASVANMLCVYDILWVNSGIAPTTTTAQTINSVAWPARDVNGSVNGEGVGVGILVTTATTNAGAITNTTMNYTNSDGTAGRTATIASWPATAVIGTFVPFQLAAGDKGVRSIQTVTLGTSYGGGAISLVAYRHVASVGHPLANVGFGSNFGPPGIRLYNGTCLLLFAVPSATTATTVTGTVKLMER